MFFGRQGVNGRAWAFASRFVFCYRYPPSTSSKFTPLIACIDGVYGPRSIRSLHGKIADQGRDDSRSVKPFDCPTKVPKWSTRSEKLTRFPPARLAAYIAASAW